MSRPKRSEFLMVRRGVFEHLKDGRMDEQMLVAYELILDQSDWDTGVWLGSSGRLREAVPAWSLSTCVRVLDRLCAGWYIKSQHVRGVRGNYPVLVNKFARPKDGVVVRDWATQDWRGAETVPTKAAGGSTPEKVKPPAASINVTGDFTQSHP